MNEYTDNNEEYELTDMQYSFYVSRNNKEKIRCCHAYFEFENFNIDIEKLKYAYKKVFEDNFILRSIIVNGKQKILDKSRYDNVNIFDFSKESDENIGRKLEEIRNLLKYRVMKIDKGQAVGLTVCILKNQKVRIIYDADLILLDVESILMLLNKISEIYLKINKPGNNNYSLKEYFSEKAINEKENESYWNEKIKYMSNGPKLLEKPESEILEYSSLFYHLSKEQLERLKKICFEKNVKIQVILLAVYIKVVSRYSENKHFIINIPVFYRTKSILDKGDVLGNFADLVLLDIDVSKEMEMDSFISYVDQEYNKCINMQPYSGIKVLRNLNKENKGNLVKANVVFSYHVNPPLVNDNISKCFGKMNYIVNQTPGVLIDFQIYGINDEYGLYWIFPKNYFKFINGAFNMYKDMLFDFINNN